MRVDYIEMRRIGSGNQWSNQPGPRSILSPAENVRLGDRTTERKASEDPPLVAAGIFMSVHGPGVVTVSSDGALAVGDNATDAGCAPLVRVVALTLAYISAASQTSSYAASSA